jgi:hypothetical protein
LDWGNCRLGPFVAACSFWAAAKKEVAMSSVVMTRTVTVNAAFLQEIKEVNKELWQRLEELRHRCQRPIAPTHCRHLVDRLSPHLTSIVERAERLLHSEQLATLALWIGPEFSEFDLALRDHESRENELIYEAYDTDIGTGD